MLNLYPIPAAQTYSEILELFKDKNRFAQGYFQYDKDGSVCPWKEGYSFCTLGALCFVTDGLSHKAQCLLQRVSEHLYGEAIQMVNDLPDGYEKVIKALEFARDLWQGREPIEEELGMKIPELLAKRNAE